MRPDCRRLLLVLALAPACVAPAHADDAGRYALSASRDGFVRLDTATGAVSHCRPDKGIWRCEPLAADDGNLRTRLDALAAEVAKLTAAVAVLDARVAAIAPVESPAATPPPTAQRSNGVRDVVSRFLDFVRAVKHSRAAATPAET
jgi:hypothetical protein